MATQIIMPNMPAPQAGLPQSGMGADGQIVQAVTSYWLESYNAMQNRRRLNMRNTDAYHGIQDWSHKQKGQTAEFVPKMPVAVEQLTSYIKRAMVDFGDWFHLNFEAQGPLTSEGLQEFIKLRLNTLPGEDGKPTTFSTRLTDAVKLALLQSMMVTKVLPREVTMRELRVERGIQIGPDGTEQLAESIGMESVNSLRTTIDIVLPEQYYRDPRARGLYEIHRVERDLHEVQAMADEGVYDPRVVDQIREDFQRSEEESRRNRLTMQNMTTPPQHRRRIWLDECWGTLLNEDGRILAKDVLVTVANSRWLLRPPEPKPLWGDPTPFTASPLIRVPFSVTHKALYDHVTEINLSLNEMYSLIVDGSIGSVWGTGQIHDDWLKDPSQIAGGIPQGETLRLTADVPSGAKVYETVRSGEVPQEAWQAYQMLMDEFNTASMVNETRLGQVAQGNPTATEVVEANQSIAVFFDSILRDVENEEIEPTLRKFVLSEMLLLGPQDAADLRKTMGDAAAIMLLQMPPVMRWNLFNNVLKITVDGLSAVSARVRDFQRISLLLQTLNENPMLMQIFMQQYDLGKLFTRWLRTLNLNTSGLERDEKSAPLPPTSPMPLGAQQQAGQLPSQQAQRLTQENLSQQQPGLAEPLEAPGLPPVGGGVG